MAALFKVKALYDFEAKEEDDLGFPGNQVIDVTEEIDDNWLEGRYTDGTGTTKSGIFPREFVEKYEPEVPTRPTRPQRQKQEPAQVAAPAPVQHDPAEAEEQEESPPVPALSKPQPPPVDIPTTTARQEEVRSPPYASSQKTVEPPPAAKPALAEPAKEAAAKKPPPVAAKSNAFRDRIAAFNQPAAAPIAPIVPGGPKPSGGFIKKPFVAPPPMANSYVPPPKFEPVHKPYIREEDPEIRRRQEEDHAAAEAAGMNNDGEAEQGDDEDAPKPTTLKERIARLQQQQLEQAQRRAEGSKKEKKTPAKKASETSEQGIAAEDEDEKTEQDRSRDVHERQSLDVSKERPRVSSSQRKPSIPMSPVPADSELVSDGNEADQSAAGETTEDDTGTIGPEDSDERHAPPPPSRAAAPPRREPDAADEGEATEDAEGEGEDEDSMDEETRRRMELRERMAKMSGGMGMGPMFGPSGGMPLPGAAPPRKRKEKKPSEEEAPSSPPPPPQQRIPMIPVTGMQRVASPELQPVRQAAERDEAAGGDRDEVYDEQPQPPPRRSTHEERGVPPPVPKDSRPSRDRAPPPPVPSTSEVPTPMPPVPASRPVPQPPSHAAPMSPGPGSESDDEMPAEASGVDTPGPLPFRQGSGGAPPVPGSAAPQSPEPRRMSYFGTEPPSATSDKRASRPPPPVPGSPLTSPRPPPPPPPGQVPSRKSTDLQTVENERGESDYEGDYDTDIASSAKHKDALKAHVREDSIESTTADDVGIPPVPPPHTSVPRAVPPPPPSQAPPKTRPSMDAPRAPPPVPPSASRPVPDTPHAPEDDEDYDPYRYDGQQRAAPPPVPGGVPVVVPPVPPRDVEPESSADDLYSTTPPRKSAEQPSRAVPAPPPTQPPPPARAPPRESLDVQRSNTTRRSMDQPRPAGDNGQMAQDLDLAENTTWWTASQPLPPVLQSRNGIDILSECEESTTSKRGGRTTVSKDVYVLYLDYSQTIITVRHDPANPADAQLEQQHRPPPPQLRQDQLEAYWQRLGRNIAETANSLGHSKKDTTVGQGSPASLPFELIKSNQAALRPIGNRAYGAVVYANLANASTQQFDEIRPGDIVTLRNTRFEGTHGAMKHKYKQEYGPMHVAIVEEWDGTRRAIRAWEQGREKPKVRSEKFRLGDLRSGEVKVWRVVGRDWVEWESGS